MPVPLHSSSLPSLQVSSPSYSLVSHNEFQLATDSLLNMAMKRSSRYAQPTPKLLSLANELIDQIFSFLIPSDLCSLARACRSLCYQASLAIPRSVTINNGASLTYFVQALARNPCIMNRVQSLTLGYSYRESGHYQALPSVEHVVGCLERLKEFNVEITRSGDTWDTFELFLPSNLAHSLTTCSIRFDDFSECIPAACKPLFEHHPMKRLSLHRCEFEPIESSSMGLGNQDTQLEVLELIDCYLDIPTFVEMLSYPASLKVLSINPGYVSADNYEVHNDDIIDFGEYFRALSATPAANSLHSLKFDFRNSGWVIVKAPGIHELTGLRYLEMPGAHLQDDPEPRFDGVPVPKWKCPMKRLFPPNLEVLKIIPTEPDFPEVFEALKRKKILFPAWRKLVVTSYYRDKAGAEAFADFQNNHPTAPLEIPVYPDLSKVTNKCRVFKKLKRACDGVGVELMVTYDDAELYRINGFPRPGWEIPEQVLPRVQQEDADVYDYCDFPESSKSYLEKLGRKAESKGRNAQHD